MEQSSSDFAVINEKGVVIEARALTIKRKD